jgi:hypothetical protein
MKFAMKLPMTGDAARAKIISAVIGGGQSPSWNYTLVKAAYYDGRRRLR